MIWNGRFLYINRLRISISCELIDKWCRRKWMSNDRAKIYGLITRKRSLSVNWMWKWTCESSSFRLVSLSSESCEKSELSSNSEVSTSLELDAKLPILLPLPFSFCIFFLVEDGGRPLTFSAIKEQFRSTFLKKWTSILQWSKEMKRN